MINNPDAENVQISQSINGLLMSTTSKSGVNVIYQYDALGRKIYESDEREGKKTHYNSKGWIDYVEDKEGHRKIYEYDPITGRKIKETNELGKVTHFAYNDLNQITHQWGNADYPVQYVYDPKDYGQLSEMYTYRSGANWDTETFPEEESGDKTTWHYDEATGNLIAKEDDAGNKVLYTYTFGGKLKTRTWARLVNGEPLVTSYFYDDKTGELIKIDYSDLTHDIIFRYNRLGQKNEITDAHGTRTFEYDEFLQPDKEIITGLLTRTIDRKFDLYGRPIGISIGDG
ncbi:sugar-binding protein, partial [Candidatus Magnetomorum sp. HK-1]